MAVKVEVKVFCVVMLCSGVVRYQRFKGPCCLHLQCVCSLPTKVPDTRFLVFMALNIQVEVLWVVIQCTDVVGYQHFRGPYCLHLQDEFYSSLPTEVPDTRFEVFMVMKIQVEVFWVVTSCSVRVGYQCFRGPCCLHLLHPEDGGSTDL